MQKADGDREEEEDEWKRGLLPAKNPVGVTE